MLHIRLGTYALETAFFGACGNLKGYKWGMTFVDHAGYMQEALAEAEKACALGEVPIGAVVVLNGEIIGRGHNLRETLKDSSAHAEILAMREAAGFIGDWRLNGATLYSTIEPCPMCAGAIVQFRVSTLVYGAADPKAGAVDSVVDLVREPRFNHRVEVVAGVLEEECRSIIRRFFRELRQHEKYGEMAELAEGARLEIKSVKCPTARLKSSNHQAL